VRLTLDREGTATPPVEYDGTLRVERDAVGTVASGDLYLRRPSGLGGSLSHEPDPAAGIPVFARNDYRYYVRVTDIAPGEGVGDVSLDVELERYGGAAGKWSREGGFTADLTRAQAPPGYPSAGDFLRGDVLDASRRRAGGVTIGWIADRLRRAVIEVECVDGCEAPLANAAGMDWRSIFAAIGWDVAVTHTLVELADPGEDGWSDAELHAALSRGDQVDLDAEWRFRLLCVRRLRPDERGRMFDAAGTDSNKVPREGAAIAAHWMIPDEEQWGLVRHLRFGTATDPYFRTAVHEIGHAMGLEHNTAENGFMRPTDAISRGVIPPQRFPENVVWAYQDEDARRLRHLPDPWVRPGGVPFRLAYLGAPSLPRDAMVAPPELLLRVTPLHVAMPIGAPVRVTTALQNSGGDDVIVPDDLSLKAGHASGAVTDPVGTRRSFRPLVRRTDRRTSPLRAGETRTGAATLLRGAEGALFPMPGPYTIEVRLEWDVDGVPFAVSGEAAVMVLAAVDVAHAEAALRVLTTPDALLTLALGGDHIDEGMAAIRAALANDVLRPHFAYTEARRLATPFLGRGPDLAAAAELIDDATVMSADELVKAAALVESASARGTEPPSRLVETLRAKALDAGAARQSPDP
jgi:hypothetical protein